MMDPLKLCRGGNVPIGSAALTVLAIVAIALPACRDSETALPNVRIPPDAPRPNVLLILIDTLRADRLGCYGHQRNLTPAIDALAADGVRFSSAVSQAPWTQPSVAALFTAMYPGSIVAVDKYRLTFDAVRRGAQAVRVLQDRHVTLAEVFKANGYNTAAINTNVYIVEEFGFAQGFDHFDAHWPEGFVASPTTGDVVNRVAEEWLEKEWKRSEPFFMYLHYMDPHGPYNAGPEYLDRLLDIVDQMPNKQRLTTEQLAQLDPRYLLKMPPVFTNQARHERLSYYREYWEARYESGVAQVDHHIANLRERLERLGLWKDLVIVLTSDHGEGIGLNGYFGHGYSVRHDELHVPLIVRSPGRLPTGKVVDELVRVMDVMPTLLDLLGLPPVDGNQGVSLVDYIRGAPTSAPLSALAEGLKHSRYEQAAIYQGEWKALLQDDPHPDALFNIADDPAERANLSIREAARLEELRRLLAEQRSENARFSAGARPAKVQISEQQIQQLKSLGYVGDSPEPGGGG